MSINKEDALAVKHIAKMMKGGTIPRYYITVRKGRSFSTTEVSELLLEGMTKEIVEILLHNLDKQKHG